MSPFGSATLAATFLEKKDGSRVLLPGDRAWRVSHVDWWRRIAHVDWWRRIAHVEATDARGRSRWKGEGRALSYAMCRVIRRILASDDPGDRWSRRARERLQEVRYEYSWVDDESTVVLLGGPLSVDAPSRR